MKKEKLREVVNTLIRSVKKIPVLRNFFSLMISEFAFPKRNLQDSLKGYKAYLFDSSYINEKDFQEPHIIKLFKDKIKENQTVFDVGAHFGYFTLLSHKLVGENGKVVSFEPSPIPLKYLRKNVNLNKLKNVKIEPLMLSNKKGIYDFYYSGFGGTMSSFKKSEGLPFHKKVFATTLDDYCFKKNIFPDFVKIDVEGADLLVIKGFIKTLKEKRINLLLELHHKILSEKEVKELINLFDSLGYKISSVWRDEKGYVLKKVIDYQLPNHIFCEKIKW